MTEITKDQKNILIVDIGSTTTKGLLLEYDGEKYFFKALANAPTTVERPQEDVNIGLRNVISALEKKSGTLIMNDEKQILMPFLATSSAGGGLQVLVFGLTRSETGKAVEATAHGAGAIIMGSFAVDDGLREMEKMSIIRELHPDLILMAGGIDKGGLWGILRQAEILSLAEPRSKFMPEAEIPLVFCGNIDAREFVKDILGEKFHIHITDNIRPTLEKFNFDPVRDKVHRLFMENVMENAPGYKEVKKAVVEDILPTPAGVEKILENYYEQHKENTLLVDMGGATTDIFSCILSKINRTVSANVGMSYSLSNIMKESGIDPILNNICECVDKVSAGNYITNKTLNPEYIPKSKGERLVELSCAVEGVKLAWKQHIDMNIEVAHLGFLDRRHKKLFRDSLCPFEEVLNLSTNKEDMFQISNINKIIGAGGVLSSSQDDGDITFILNEGFFPVGVTELYVDKFFKSPHMGLFSMIDKEKAVETFERESLRRVCTVITPVGKSRESVAVLSVTNLNENETAIMNLGDVFYSKHGGKYKFETLNGFVLGAQGETVEIETENALLLDCRGRDDLPDSRKVFKAIYGEPKEPEMTNNVLKDRNEIFKGEFGIKRSLPYKGEITAIKGQKVRIDTVIGRNLFNPPKIYMIDVRKHVGDKYRLTKDDIRNGLTVKNAEMIDFGQVIFSFNPNNDIMPKTYHSNVRGEIIKIDEYGMIVVKEIQDYGDDPVVVNVAKELDVAPKSVPKLMKFPEGSFVYRNQIIANKTTGSSTRDILSMITGVVDEKKDHAEGIDAEILSVRAPSTGYIMSIDKKTGEVTIQYESKPLDLRSFLNGEVAHIHEGTAVDINVNGSYAYCIIGFGGETSGKLHLSESNNKIESRYSDGIIVFTGQISKDVLDQAKQLKVKGVIAPSINYNDWVEFSGQELGVAVTGKEQIGFTLMLTEGFGRKGMNREYEDYFKENEGKTAGINGRTQIRAGVIRPRVIIS